MYFIGSKIYPERHICLHILNIYSILITYLQYHKLQLCVPYLTKSLCDEIT